MQTLPTMLGVLWGRTRARAVAESYRLALAHYPLLARDLALFCNAAAPVTGLSEFDRGVEEGKRRVWLHAARLARLKPQDFVSLADGEPDHVDD